MFGLSLSSPTYILILLRFNVCHIFSLTFLNTWRIYNIKYFQLFPILCSLAVIIDRQNCKLYHPSNYPSRLIDILQFYSIKFFILSLLYTNITIYFVFSNWTNRYASFPALSLSMRKYIYKIIVYIYIYIKNHSCIQSTSSIFLCPRQTS